MFIHVCSPTSQFQNDDVIILWMKRLCEGIQVQLSVREVSLMLDKLFETQLKDIISDWLQYQGYK